MREGGTRNALHEACRVWGDKRAKTSCIVPAYLRRFTAISGVPRTWDIGHMPSIEEETETLTETGYGVALPALRVDIVNNRLATLPRTIDRINSDDMDIDKGSWGMRCLDTGPAFDLLNAPTGEAVRRARESRVVVGLPRPSSVHCKEPDLSIPIKVVSAPFSVTSEMLISISTLT